MLYVRQTVGPPYYVLLTTGGCVEVDLEDVRYYTEEQNLAGTIFTIMGDIFHS